MHREQEHSNLLVPASSRWLGVGQEILKNHTPQKLEVQEKREKVRERWTDRHGGNSMEKSLYSKRKIGNSTPRGVKG